MRGVSAVAISQIRPDTTLAVGPITPIDENFIVEVRQEMDSRIPDTTSPWPGGRTWGAPAVHGVTTIRFRENIYTTSCSILPAELLFDFPVIVVGCAPKFSRVPSGDILRLDPGPTYIYIDPGLGP